MSLIAIDAGGTKIAGAFLTRRGTIVEKITDSVFGLEGDEIGQVICDQINTLISRSESKSNLAEAVGISVPGIYHIDAGTVWAPNLPGWESYPLRELVLDQCKKNIPVVIDSDRSCYILGEVWMGNAQGCKDAIFLAVGTGIGAGILANGEILRGTGNSAGAVGWMGLNRPHKKEYAKYGCFEYHASGKGLVRIARNYLETDPSYKGTLTNGSTEKLNTKDIFEAYRHEDPIAVRVISEAVEFWGMAAANLVSIFNPEKILFGGGVFEAAAPLIDRIREETKRWAQPIAINEVSIETAWLGNEAGIFGAAYLALQSLNSE